MNVDRPYCYLREERTAYQGAIGDPDDGEAYIPAPFCISKLQSFYIRQGQKWIKKGLMCPDCNKIVMGT